MHLTPITALHAWYFKSIPLSSTETFHNLINPLTADSCFAENCWYKSLQLCLKYHFFCSIFSANSVSNTISSAQYSLPILSQIPFLLLNILCQFYNPLFLCLVLMRHRHSTLVLIISINSTISHV